MADGLFGGFGGGAEEVPKKEMPKKERRVKLFPWDSVATQMLEPYGESSFDSMSLDALWAATAKGNKSAEYHSHLCAPQDQDPWHVGAGISLTAAALLAAMKHFRDENIKMLLKPEWYEKIEAEVKKLEPTLRILNLGKGSQVQRDTGSFRQAKKQKTGAFEATGTPPTAEDMKNAAKNFHQWLKQDKSPFRSFLFIVSASNTYYTAHIAETVARAGVAHKPMSVEDFQLAMEARNTQAPPASTASASTASGLFEM
ncbi:unnamed protein product [Symbiodinium sp. CCMP2592]|nr:unnamed protein product [Symbiodinium sp. CCMP2592]